MSEVVPFELTEVAAGRVVFESTPDEKFYNTADVIHGGYAMTLLDTCIGIAIYSTLAPAIRYTTIETKVNFIRPITAAPEGWRRSAPRSTPEKRPAPRKGDWWTGQAPSMPTAPLRYFYLPVPSDRVTSVHGSPFAGERQTANREP